MPNVFYVGINWILSTHGLYWLNLKNVIADWTGGISPICVYHFFNFIFMLLFMFVVFSVLILCIVQYINLNMQPLWCVDLSSINHVLFKAWANVFVCTLFPLDKIGSSWLSLLTEI